MDKFIWRGKVKFPKMVEPLLVPLEELTQFRGNPNNADMDRLSESIQENGFTTVITVDARTKQIIAGNHRWQVLHELGATHIPVVYVEYETENQAKKMLIADNRINRLGQDDQGLLIEMLTGLEDDGETLVGTGFDETELAWLIESNQEEDPLMSGFGEPEPPMYGIYETIVAFETADDRDDFFVEMKDRFGDQDGIDIRTVDV